MLYMMSEDNDNANMLPEKKKQPVPPASAVGAWKHQW